MTLASRDRPEGRLAALAAFAGALCIFALAGCCGVPPPPAEKFFNRTTPLETLRGFVYAVDSRQWGYAYDSLSGSSREEVGYLKFQAAILYLDDPLEGQVALFDLISNSIYRKTAARPVGPDLAAITVVTHARDDRGKLVHFEAQLLFQYEDGEWHFDLLRSLDTFPRESGLHAAIPAEAPAPAGPEKPAELP
jgi:hypothetical protein